MGFSESILYGLPVTLTNSQTVSNVALIRVNTTILESISEQNTPEFKQFIFLECNLGTEDRMFFGQYIWIR